MRFAFSAERFALKAAVIVLAVLFFQVASAAQAPTVTITSPSNGEAFDTNNSVITVTGTVTNPGNSTAQLLLNGEFIQNIALDTSASPPTFSNSLVLVSGQNEITVSDTNLTGTGSARVTVSSTRGRNDIRVNLVWDHSSSDVDLYLFVPPNSATNVDSYVIWFANQNPPQGGNLDVDNTRAFGPENISFVNGSNPPSGEYVVAVNLFRVDNSTPVNARATVFLNEGTAVEQIISFDTILLTVANGGGDVRTGAGGNTPTMMNSTSTVFFTFAFELFQTTRTERILAAVVSYPNPVMGPNPTVTFSSRASIDSGPTGLAIKEVSVYDMRGTRVRRLVPGSAADKVTWNARTVRGELIGSGHYFYLINFTDGQTGRGRFTVVK